MSMQIKIAKSELLKILKVNRDEHRRLFNDSMDGFRKAVVVELGRLLVIAESKAKIELSLKLPHGHPVCHDLDYARAIVMVEASAEGFVSLDEDDFQTLYENDWYWSGDFSSSCSSYSPSLSSLSESV